MTKWNEECVVGCVTVYLRQSGAVALGASGLSNTDAARVGHALLEAAGAPAPDPVKLRELAARLRE